MRLIQINLSLKANIKDLNRTEQLYPIRYEQSMCVSLEDTLAYIRSDRN